ncbi:hypothetical protein Asulf_01399 [Archaeoglobus sulfaticallidus PM70-1]|uniref:Uncharacterized protein n=1 Tax=Archaeoglobus sulfaticallidus PM70-1 TaxID=387631 RepID=N0BEE9_9EURY|nr:hypothetical protein [Archaeoglobus sulfaticallidus]AGK61388.1 hypothetical protein Asulf_01399 [Archaeoglobus sulfaticallidus PM70-1]
MGRSVASVRIQLNGLIAKIERAKSLMKREEVVYADRVIEAIKKRYSVCYYAFDSAEEAALFSLTIELMRLIDHADSGCFSVEKRNQCLAEKERCEESLHQT